MQPTPAHRRAPDRAHDKLEKLVFHRPSGRWTLIYYDLTGKRRFVSTKCTELADARSWARDHRDELGSQRRGHEKLSTAEQQAVTIGRLLEELLEADTAARLRSVRTYRYHVEKHLRPVLGAVRAESLTLRQLEAVRTAWLAARLSPSSINRYVNVLQKAYRRGLKHGTIGSALITEWPYYDEREFIRQQIITPAELEAVNTADPWPAARDFNTWAFFTGMRFGEISGLRWEYVDRATWTISLPPTVTKTKEGRILPIPAELPELRALLARRAADRRPDCPFVFHHDGQPLDDAARWARSWARAGLDTRPSLRDQAQRYRRPIKVFHDMRKTAVKNLLDAGVSEVDVMAITGHRSPTIFRRHYVVFQAQRVARAFQKLGAMRAALTPRPTLTRAPGRRSTPGHRAARTGRSPLVPVA